MKVPKPPAQAWHETVAGEVGRFRGGNGFPVQYQGKSEGDYPFYKVSDMNNVGNDTFMLDANNWITEPVRKGIGAMAFPAGTIVFAKVGAAVFLERKKILSRPSCIDNNLAGFVLDGSRADVRFVHYQLLNTKLSDLVATTALPSLNGSTLAGIQIALPPLPEQRAIAAALSDVDALISALDQLIAKKRDLKTATMQQLLTGQRRLPGFTGAWEMKRLGDLFSFLRTAHNPRADLTAQGEVGYVHYGDIHTSASAFLDVTTLALPRIRGALVTGANLIEDGDLIMADASEDYDGIGKCVEISGTDAQKVVAGLHTFLLRGDKQQLADGFKGYMQAIPAIRSSLVRLATGISVYGVSKNNVKTIEVALPSVKEQQAIAHVLRDMDAELEALEERRDKTRLLKQGMMQELLTGRTRLVPATT